jgi:accessory colonization factor AcfC
MPLPENEFDYWVNKWVSEDLKGKTAKSKKMAGFVNNKLMYIEIEGTSEIAFRDASDIKQPIFEKWEDFLAD